jgi:glycerol-3-phosphate dehydrogenase
MTKEIYDLAIIGGGINGIGIARDAAGRGLSVVLIEQGDFAGATSSASSKLIHGGLRYLEQYEFRLVSEALSEREKLLNIAPHIAWPMQFIMPHVEGLRPRWMIKTGLFLYDRLGGRISLPKSQSIRLSNSPYGSALKKNFEHAFRYSDAWVDDARLVLLNAQSALQHGAVLYPRVSLEHANRTDGHWQLHLQPDAKHPHPEQIPNTVTAKVLINATGPWVKKLQQRLNISDAQSLQGNLKLVQGSHMVVPRCYEGNHAYILQNQDRRVIFMLPYEQDYTLIGTTDTLLENPDQAPKMTDEEVRYLCDAVNYYLEKPISPKDAIWRYSGVRPLLDDGSDNASKVTRDYTLVVDAPSGEAPMLTVLGGKLTTYRKLAEHALEKLATFFPELTESWTHVEPLPGGDIEHGWAGFEAWQQQFLLLYPNLDQTWLKYFSRRYGRLSGQILGSAMQIKDLGEYFGGGLYALEVRYLHEKEWAWQADDILWRRTKAGLHMSEQQRQYFTDWFDREMIKPA